MTLGKLEKTGGEKEYLSFFSVEKDFLDFLDLFILDKSSAGELKAEMITLMLIVSNRSAA